MVALSAGTLYDKLGLEALKDAAVMILVSLPHKSPKQDAVWDENLDAPAATVFESMAVQKRSVHTLATEDIPLYVL